VSEGRSGGASSQRGCGRRVSRLYLYPRLRGGIVSEA
jgi:hypothetical protein